MKAQTPQYEPPIALVDDFDDEDVSVQVMQVIGPSSNAKADARENIRKRDRKYEEIKSDMALSYKRQKVIEESCAIPLTQG